MPPRTESFQVMPSPASTATSAARTKASFLASFLVEHLPLVPAQLMVVLVAVHQLAATQVHQDPLAQMQAEMLMLPAPDLSVAAQAATQALQALDLLVAVQVATQVLRAPDLLVEVEVQVATQALQARARLASTAMPALILTWPASWAASSHPPDRQLSTAPLTLLATARSLAKPSSTSSLN
jgi:hypothetical protein